MGRSSVKFTQRALARARALAWLDWVAHVELTQERDPVGGALFSRRFGEGCVKVAALIKSGEIEVEGFDGQVMNNYLCPLVMSEM